MRLIKLYSILTSLLLAIAPVFLEAQVKITDGSFLMTATPALNNEVRVNDMTHNSVRKSDGTGTPAYLKLVAGYSDDTLSFDPLVIYFDENATSNFDGLYDALKLFNTDTNVTNFYSFGSDGSQLSINAVPVSGHDTSTIRLGLKTLKSCDVIFRIKFITEDFNYDNIVLTDIVTGESRALLTDNEYIVNLPAGNYQDRFFLNLSSSVMITDVREVHTDNGWFNIYSSHGIIKADINLPDLQNGTLKIFNLLGEVQNIYKIFQPGHHEFYPKIKTGIYIVNFNSGNRAVSKKIYIMSQ